MPPLQATPENIRRTGEWLNDVFGPGSVTERPFFRDGTRWFKVEFQPPSTTAADMDQQQELLSMMRDQGIAVRVGSSKNDASLHSVAPSKTSMFLDMRGKIKEAIQQEKKMRRNGHRRVKMIKVPAAQSKGLKTTMAFIDADALAQSWPAIDDIGRPYEQMRWETLESAMHKRRDHVLVDAGDQWEPVEFEGISDGDPEERRLRTFKITHGLPLNDEPATENHDAVLVRPSLQEWTARVDALNALREKERGHG